MDLLEIARYDDATEAVIVLGEIGGRAEEELAAHIRKTGFPKPLLAFVAGRTAPPGKRLGHAGAILEEGAAQGIEGKLDTLRQAGFTICPDLESIPALVRQALGVRQGFRGEPPPLKILFGKTYYFRLVDIRKLIKYVINVRSIL